MDRDFEEFCAAFEDLSAARRSFLESSANEPCNPVDTCALVAALNEATYRYLSAVRKLGESAGVPRYYVTPPILE